MSAEGQLVPIEPADRRVEDIRARLLLAQQHTHVTIVALRAEIAEKTDWRNAVRNRPALFLSAAFAFGFFVARRR